MRAADAITLGVEEEFVLLDPSTGATVLAAAELVRMLGGEPGVRTELMRFQVETASAVCTSLDEAGRELTRLRRLAADAAAQLGCRLVASGVAPYGTPGLAAVTGQPRYQELARRYGRVVAEAGTCACHVHIGVPSREAGVQVLARLRPWLAPLLAVSANSPIAGGHETGWASWRYPIWSRWPTAVPPAAWPDAAAYDTAVRRLIGQGAALDERSVYFLARLSPRYPTVEVRVVGPGFGCRRHQVPRCLCVSLRAGRPVDDHPGTTHGRVDTVALPRVSREERDLRLSVALTAGEHAHVLAGIDEPGNDRSSQAACAARDENWRRHRSFPHLRRPAKGAGCVHSTSSITSMSAASSGM